VTRYRSKARLVSGCVGWGANKGDAAGATSLAAAEVVAEAAWAAAAPAWESEASSPKEIPWT